MAGDDLLDYDSGRRFGRYTIVRRISVGGMAEVFLALARGPGEFKKFVTLKRILPDYRDDDRFVSMFLEEARISASLAHANIAQVFDLGNEGGDLYLAMEFVPGEDLSRVLKTEVQAGRKPPVGFSAMVMRDALLALHHAHTFVDAAGVRTPVVHRDISPRNVMVTYAGTVKVIDFGIARVMGLVGLIGSGVLRGSSGYISPEQMSGGLIDARSDIFAVGVLLHELLVGRRLFPNKGQGKVADMELSEVVSPHDIDAAIPRALSDVAMKALSFDVRDRWQSARDMARAIEQAASGEMWDEDRAAGYMQGLFRDNLERMRRTVQLATQPGMTARELGAAAAAIDDPAVGSPSQDSADTRTAQLVQSARPGSSEPANAGQRATGSRERAAQQGPTTTTPRRPVIVAVDDSNASLQLLKYHMNRIDIDVVTCVSPSDAIETIRSATPDAIILDVMMPEIDGFELCKLIRALPSAQSVPILFLSAACNLDERTKCLDAGGDDFVKKPYVPEELGARLRSHFGRAAAMMDQPR